MSDERKEKLIQIRDKMSLQLDDKQYVDFVHLLYDNSFLHNISDFDIEWNIGSDHEDHEFSLGTLKNNGISIGAYINDDDVLFGLDPSNCFNKTFTCSILVRFPMSKRDYRLFLAVFNKLLDNKSTFRKAWEKAALSSWCGTYAKFGRV